MPGSPRSFAPMKPRAWLTAFVSTATAALVWALSPLLDGHREPWDTDGSVLGAAFLLGYSLIFLAAAALAAFARTRLSSRSGHV
jgi:hypothetical protein